MPVTATGEVQYTKEQVDACVRRHAATIYRYYRALGVQELWLLICLQGAMYYGVDVSRAIRRLDPAEELPLGVDVTYYTRYGNETTGAKVEVIIPIPAHLAGKHVLVIEDIIEGGVTLKAILDDLAVIGPASINLAVLTMKPGLQEVELPAPLVTPLEVTGWVEGAGLDTAKRRRELPHLQRRA
ncbi:hypothetical protein HY374_00915 [Candidatus Berkelbacteria bacterium]|nr:hypothetical protein [Candidatus Berkelbacteria bacterium]